MRGTIESGAVQFLPTVITLDSLRRTAKGCRGCSLFKHATQTVFGKGPIDAHLMLIGEQPGNEEDLAGEPFVGPAGMILDEALLAAGIDREDAYVTNVVKHFKWTPKGKRRIHQKPGAQEIAACLPWLENEIKVIQPQVLVCLGATAAQALFGREFRVSTQRGQWVRSPFARYALATIHPSSILRQLTPEDREREMNYFIDDLKIAAKSLNAPITMAA